MLKKRIHGLDHLCRELQTIFISCQAPRCLSLNGDSAVGEEATCRCWEEDHMTVQLRWKRVSKGMWWRRRRLDRTNIKAIKNDAEMFNQEMHDL
jgi:hypothetical protein